MRDRSPAAWLAAVRRRSKGIISTMSLNWKIQDADIEEIRGLVSRQETNPFFQLRKSRNVDHNHPPISRDRFWMAMIGCLLTTQQRSGPGSAVNRLLNSNPFALRYRNCVAQPDIEAFVLETITNSKGIRRGPTIANWAKLNFDRLEAGLWDSLLSAITALDLEPNKLGERALARTIDLRLMGFGPKQSRNLIQWVGTSMYEIPIDARVIKWLNKNLTFPDLSSQALSDLNFYELVLDEVQALCQRAGILPCLLDAAVFSSFDTEEWSEANLGSSMLLGA